SWSDARIHRSCGTSAYLWECPNRKPLADLIGPGAACPGPLVLLGFRAEEFHVTDPQAPSPAHRASRPSGSGSPALGRCRSRADVEKTGRAAPDRSRQPRMADLGRKQPFVWTERK